MTLYGVSFEPIGKQPIVLLKALDEERFLPIWIGHPEAAAILMKLQGASPPRPMTHDLLTDVVSELKGEVVRVTVTELRENTYFAKITIVHDGQELEIDSRPSDAIALAVRCEAQIFAADDVVEESGNRVRGRRRRAGQPRHGFEPRRPRSGGVQQVHRERHSGGVRLEPSRGSRGRRGRGRSTTSSPTTTTTRLATQRR